jgi:hypothetical protein
LVAGFAATAGFGATADFAAAVAGATVRVAVVAFVRPRVVADVAAGAVAGDGWVTGDPAGLSVVARGVA